MTNLAITRHAAVRLPQRGLSLNDIDLIVAFGTEVRDGYFMRAADARFAAAEYPSFAKRIERLPGKCAIFAENLLITAYATTRKKQRRLLRRRV